MENQNSYITSRNVKLLQPFWKTVWKLLREHSYCMTQQSHFTVNVLNTKVNVLLSCVCLFCDPASPLCSWDFPGKNTGMGSHSRLQRIFFLPDPGTEPRSPAVQADSLPSEPPGARYTPN